MRKIRILYERRDYMKRFKVLFMTLLCAALLLPAVGVKADPVRIDEVSLSKVNVLGEDGALNWEQIEVPEGASYRVDQAYWYQTQNGKVTDVATSAKEGETCYVIITLQSLEEEVFGDEEHKLAGCSIDGTALPKLTEEQIAGLDEEGTCADGYYYSGEAGQFNIISLCMSVTFPKSAEPEPVEPEPVEPEPVAPAKPVLLLKSATSGSKAIKLSWNKIAGAGSYDIYGCACGSKIRKLKTVKKNAFTVKKIGTKKMVSHKVYKFYVVAKAGSTKLATSETAHLITARTKGKYANAVSIKPKKQSVQLTVGGTTTIGAKVKIYKGKKHLGKGHGAKLKYISSDPRIASVDQQGRVSAQKKGTVNIYIQDTSGIYCVTVIRVGD